MVAYSFQPMFLPAIKVGLGLNRGGLNLEYPKRQTIRAIGRRRHARPGEELQLYRGMRTKTCELIGLARCTDVQPIEIHFRGQSGRHCARDWVRIGGKKLVRVDRLHDFARDDGFSNWIELRRFWREHHPGIDDFEGLIILWEPMQ